MEEPGVLLPTPAPEVLEVVLSRRYGPLPRVAAIARLRRQPAGDYQPAGDLAAMLERRQVANAKERERVRGPPGGCPGELVSFLEGPVSLLGDLHQS